VTSCPPAPASPWSSSGRAIAHRRELRGATDPAAAAPGSIRKDFAASIEANAIHGSDAPKTAAFEIGYFFPGVSLLA
jgi:nucleoside-diphosphate kinase